MSLIWREKAVAAVIFVAIYALYVCYNLNYFYVRGASVYDAGWFSWLASHSVSWPMPNPGNIGGNFLSIHFSPIFFAASFLNRAFGYLPDAVKFSVLFSTWVPVFWLAMFGLTACFYGLPMWGRIGLSTLLTFSGLNFSMLGFPHIESFAPAFALLGLVILLRAGSFIHVFASIILFGLALLIREDIGFHLFLVVAGLWLCSIASRGLFARRLAGLAVVNFIYAVLALAVQKFFVPAGGSQISHVYFGDPPFAQISLHFIAHRLIYWLTRRDYIFVPVGILAGVALFGRTGRRDLAVGIVVALPWLLLSLLAVTEPAGQLWDYYCFPLVFIFVWPLLLANIVGERPGLLRLQAAMGVASLVVFLLMGTLPFVGDGGSHDRAPWLHLRPPAASVIAKTEADIAVAGPVIMDGGAASIALGSLRPEQYRQAEKFTPQDVAQASGYLRFVTAPPPYLADKTAMLAAAFPDCTRLPGTYLEMCRKVGS